MFMKTHKINSNLLAYTLCFSYITKFSNKNKILFAKEKLAIIYKTIGAFFTERTSFQLKIQQLA